MYNYPKPREITRKKNFPYKFKITTNYEFDDTNWSLDIPFVSKWLEIDKNGHIKIKANKDGYAWDGCTPKWSLFNLLIIGTPDGHVNYRTMQPYAYYASLVHDALYQYLDTVPVTKSKIDRLFLKMLGDFKLRYLYYYSVKFFGGMSIKQNGLKPSSLAEKHITTHGNI